MTSAFSSSDREVIDRETVVKEKLNVKTLVDEVASIYEIDRCANFIREHECKRVALQFPDELLGDAVKVTRLLQIQTSVEVFLLADTSYGSYDIDETAAQHVHADLIIHYGRSALTPSSNTKTLFVFGRRELHVDEAYNAFCMAFPDTCSKIVLMIQLQWIHASDALKALLLKKYPNLVVATVNVPDSSRLASKKDFCDRSCPDCTCQADKQEMDTSNNAVDSDHVNDKKFYEVGCYKIKLAIASSLEDYALFFIGLSDNETLRNIHLHHSSCVGHIFDPTTSLCSKISFPANRMLMKRFYVIEQIKDAKSVGILVGTLGMSGYLDIIDHLKKVISACGKKAYTFVVGKLNPNKLANFPEIDVFVLVACPEESLVDQSDYYKPVCTPYEVELACNANREWGNIYPLDFRQLLPGGKFHVEFKPRSHEGDVSLITGNIRNHDKNCNNVSSEVEVRNLDSTLSIFHPRAAAHHFAGRTWKGLEQKLGETPVGPAKEGRSGLPVSYSREMTS